MSWTVKKTTNGHNENEKAINSLDHAIQEAARNDIIMLCSVEDSSQYGKDQVYPQSSDTKKLLVIGSADEDGDRSKFVKEKSFDYLFPGEVTIPGFLAKDDVGSSVATAIAAGMAAMILWCAEHHSVTICASQNIEREPRTSSRTASQWDFRKYGRMNELFKALRSTDNKFVDVTTVINHAMQHIDDLDEMSLEKQSTCTKEFITMCKEYLPTEIRLK